jgi:hypothetical protein
MNMVAPEDKRDHWSRLATCMSGRTCLYLESAIQWQNKDMRERRMEYWHPNGIPKAMYMSMDSMAGLACTHCTHCTHIGRVDTHSHTAPKRYGD